MTLCLHTSCGSHESNQWHCPRRGLPYFERKSSFPNLSANNSTPRSPWHGRWEDVLQSCNHSSSAKERNHHLIFITQFSYWTYGRTKRERGKQGREAIVQNWSKKLRAPWNLMPSFPCVKLFYDFLSPTYGWSPRLERVVPAAMPTSSVPTQPSLLCLSNTKCSGAPAHHDGSPVCSQWSASGSSPSLVMQICIKFLWQSISSLKMSLLTNTLLVAINKNYLSSLQQTESSPERYCLSSPTWLIYLLHSFNPTVHGYCWGPG